MSSLPPLRLPHLDPSRTGDPSEDLRRVEDWLNTVLPQALQSWGAASDIGAPEEQGSSTSEDSGGGGGGGGSDVDPGTVDGQVLRWDDTDGRWVPADGANLSAEGVLTITAAERPLFALINTGLLSADQELYSFQLGQISGLTGFGADGDYGSEAATLATQGLVALRGGGYDGSVYTVGGLWILRAVENWGPAAKGTQWVAQTTPVGSTAAMDVATLDDEALAVDGKVLAGAGLGAPITAASALGALTGVREAFDETGASMGWVPVYASFTP